MITLFAIKPFTGNASDGIDNSNTAVFGGLADSDVQYIAELPDDFTERGAIRRMRLVCKNRFGRLFEKLMLLRRMKPDFIVGIGGVRDIPFLLVKPQGTKYIIFWQTILLKRSEGLWRVRTPWWLRRFTFDRADCVIGVSEFAAESVRKYFLDKKVVSALVGVNLELFQPQKKNQASPRPIVSFVGLLQPRKRPDIFIEIARRYPAADFVMVGRPSPQRDYLSSVKEVKNLQWIERMSREEVAMLFASSAAFIFPSVREPGAAVILESMASGAVPIVSASGGNGEFFKDGESGFLVPVDGDEVEIFIQKLNLVLTDQDRRNAMSHAARAEAEKHSYAATGRKYEEIIRSLVR